MNANMRAESRFAAKWIIVCGVGLAAGLAVAFASAGPLEAIVGIMLVTPIMFGIAGSTLGAAQLVALWRNVRAAVIWIAASAVGLGIGTSIAVVLVEVLGRAITGEQVRLFGVGPVGRFLGLAMVGAVAGAAVGLSQGLALRIHGARGSLGRWVLQCAMGFGLGLPAGGVAAELLPGGLAGPAGFGMFLVVAGLTVGALTCRNAAELSVQQVNHAS